MLAGVVALIVLACQLHVVTMPDGNGLRIPGWIVLDPEESSNLVQHVSSQNPSSFKDLLVFTLPSNLKDLEACLSHLLHFFFPISVAAPLVEADKEANEENYLLWRLENGIAEGSSEIPKGIPIFIAY